MIGAPIGTAIGGTLQSPSQAIENSKDIVALSISSIIIPESPVAEGLLIRSSSALWFEIARRLAADWSLAVQLPWDKWEEMIAGAFKNDGFDEVILTPRSGDLGRDLIAIRRGVGTVKIIGSVKAYKPGNLVSYDSIRALAGVLDCERDASKGILTTTSDFPPGIARDRLIGPLIPTRLELINGENLQKWLARLATSQHLPTEEQ